MAAPIHVIPPVGGATPPAAPATPATTPASPPATGHTPGHTTQRAPGAQLFASCMSVLFMAAATFVCVFPKALTVSGLQIASDWWSVACLAYIWAQIRPLYHPERFHSASDIWDVITSPLAAGVIVLALPIAWLISNLLGSGGWWWPVYYVLKIWVPSAIAASIDLRILVVTYRVAQSHAHP